MGSDETSTSLLRRIGRRVGRRIGEELAMPPRRCEERYRHELKYLISYGQKADLNVRMAPLLDHDSHARDGSYTIRSLYFDDYWNTAYQEKVDGVLTRKKYRIRIYDYSDRVIKLERKRKSDSWIYKEDAPLTHEQFDRILAGDVGFMEHSEHQLCREFYVEYVSNVLRPRVIVDYEREPWILDAGTVRVTFDMDVRAAVDGFDIFDRTLPTLPVLEPGKLVMEVKFTEFLPQIVRDILPGKAQEITAASKYVLCCDKASYLRGFDYWQEGWNVPSV